MSFAVDACYKNGDVGSAGMKRINTLLLLLKISGHGHILSPGDTKNTFHIKSIPEHKQIYILCIKFTNLTSVELLL